MADYVLPDVVEKRVRYFDGQFLQDQDFIDEQDYQLDREHRHNRLLHGPGIAEGLTVTSAAVNQVTVAPGTAIDGDGTQLVLAQATTVDLPAADYNNKQGVLLYLSYLASAEDQQTSGGSSDFTRWLERPQLTALAPGAAYSGTAPPVLLASLSLDNAGRVTADNTARTYSGLRLPGAGANAATLRATSGTAAELTGGLTIAGAGGQSVDLLVNGRLRSDNNDGGLWVSQDRFVGGFGSAQIGLWNNGNWRLAVQNNGNTGIGTTTPQARLEVAGSGGTSVDLLVNGRLRSNNNDGGLWVSQDRFVGGYDTNKIGFWNNGDWRFAVLTDGTTYVQKDLFVAGRIVYQHDSKWWTIYPTGTPSPIGIFGLGGNTTSSSTNGPSDVRLKTDLRPVSNALDLVRKLQAVRYRWGERGLRYFTEGIDASVCAGPDATEEEHERACAEQRDKALAALAGDRLGLIAQDVEAVLPELVHEDAGGYKHVRYQHLTAVLAEAIKEQDSMLAALSAKVAALSAEVAALQAQAMPGQEAAGS